MDLVNNKDIMGDIMEYCPYLTPRPGQNKAIPEIKKALDDGVLFTFLYAPTGAGKSGIARTFADYFAVKGGRSFIGSSTKDLQKQYIDGVHASNDYLLHFEKIVGRNNFKCNLLTDPTTSTIVTCDEGLCRSVNYFEAKINKDWETLDLFKLGDGYCWESCEYMRALQLFKKCDVGICNYDILLNDSLYAHNYPTRSILICDEAHNLIDKLREFSKLTINLNTINSKLSYQTSKKEYPFDIHALLNYNYEEYVFEDEFDWLHIPDFLSDYYESDYKDSILTSFDDDQKESAPTISRIESFLKSLIMKKNRIITNQSNYVFEDFKDNKGNKVSCSFTPLTIDRGVSDLIFQKGLQIILMSASFTKPEFYAQLLGLNENEYRIITVPEERNLKEINPCYYHNCGSMKKANRKKIFPKVCSEIHKIMNYSQNKDKKGVIHVPTYKCGEYLMENLDSSRLIFHKDKNEKDMIIREFKQSDEPLVLVSPTSFEGVDFPYDDCRFQILTCLPVPPFNNFYKTLLKENPDEARMMVATKVVQLLGRGCRASDDYCENHLLDNRFTWCSFESNNLIKSTDFPKPIRECFKRGEVWKYWNKQG